MAARNEVLSASELEPFDSIISVIDGSSRFCIENPYFPVPGSKITDINTFLAVRPGGDTSRGVYMNSPSILYRPAGRGKTFHNKFSIVYRKGQDEKAYYIRSPYQVTEADHTARGKQRLRLSPGDLPTDGKVLLEEDFAILTFDWQISMAMEVLILAHVFKINLKTFTESLGDKSNRTFLNALFENIKDSLARDFGSMKNKSKRQFNELRDTFVIDEEYIDSFNAPPMRMQNETELFTADSTNEELVSFETIGHKVINIVNEFKLRKPMIDSKHYANVEQYISTAEQEIFSGCGNFHGYVGKDHMFHHSFDLNCVIYQDVGTNRKMNWKFAKIARKSRGGPKQYVDVTAHDVANLWGGQYYNASSPINSFSERWQGAITITPELDIAIYTKGHAKITWVIQRLTIYKVRRQDLSIPDDGCDIPDDYEDETVKRPVTTYEDGDIMLSKIENDSDGSIADGADYV